MKPKKKLEKSVNLRLTREEYEWLEKQAEREDRTVSGCIRRILRDGRGGSELLEACKKVLELARDTEFMEHPTMEFVAGAVKRAEGR